MIAHLLQTSLVLTCVRESDLFVGLSAGDSFYFC